MEERHHKRTGESEVGDGVEDDIIDEGREELLEGEKFHVYQHLAVTHHAYVCLLITSYFRARGKRLQNLLSKLIATLERENFWSRLYLPHLN